ncbi:hypothetical protein [Flagellimonas sp. 2504JD4-2]
MENMDEFTGSMKTNSERHLQNLQNGMQDRFQKGVDKDRESLLAQLDGIKKKTKGVLGHWALSKGERNLLDVAQQAEVQLAKTMTAANHSMVAIQCQSAIELTRSLHQALHQTFSSNVLVGKAGQITSSKRKIYDVLAKDNEEFAVYFDRFQKQIEAASPALRGYLEKNRDSMSIAHFEAHDKLLNDFLQGLDMNITV